MDYTNLTMADVALYGVAFGMLWCIAVFAAMYLVDIVAQRISPADHRQNGYRPTPAELKREWDARHRPPPPMIELGTILVNAHWFGVMADWDGDMVTATLEMQPPMDVTSANAVVIDQGNESLA